VAQITCGTIQGTRSGEGKHRYQGDEKRERSLLCPDERVVGIVEKRMRTRNIIRSLRILRQSIP